MSDFAEKAKAEAKVLAEKAKAEAEVLYAEVVEELATLEGQDMMGPSDPESQEKEEPKPEPTGGTR